MVNPLENFLNFSSLAFWQKRNQSVVGLDIGASSVKVVQLRKEKGKVILETYGEISTGPYRGLSVGQAATLPIDKTSELLRDLFTEANVSTNLGSMAIPLSSSLLLIIEIPRVSENMLAKVIPLEARKYIPVPISEVALDWWVIPSQDINPQTNNQEKLEALVVAIHNTIINQYQELARMVSINPAFFEIETFSALRSVFGGEMTPTAILDVGAGSTKMVVVDYGIVRLSHTIPKGSQDITMAISRSLGLDFAKAEEIKRKVGLVEQFDGQDISTTISSLVEFIFTEANKVIADYQQKHHRAVQKIMFIGGGALLRGLIEVAGKNFEMPVELGRPFSKVEAPAFLEEVLNEAGPGFAVAIGLALRHLQSLD
jgi:type IV pilus assembly protein PilM